MFSRRLRGNGRFVKFHRTISLHLVDINLVSQEIVPTFELPSAECTFVPWQFPAAFAQMSGQRVRPRVTFPALVTDERGVVIDAVVVPLRVWNRSQKRTTMRPNGGFSLNVGTSFLTVRNGYLSSLPTRRRFLVLPHPHRDYREVDVMHRT